MSGCDGDYLIQAVRSCPCVVRTDIRTGEVTIEFCDTHRRAKRCIHLLSRAYVVLKDLGKTTSGLLDEIAECLDDGPAEREDD